MAQIFLTTTGAQNWTVPSDWNNSNNTIEVIGDGSGAYYSGYYYAGAGGGYSSISNKSLTPGTSIPYFVGRGAGTNGAQFGDGTWFGNASYASSYVAAEGGQSNGGAAANGIGTTKYSGGNRGNNGGGGAAGPHGDGAVSVLDVGGNADAGYGGAGGASLNPGGNGTEWDSTHGSGGGGGKSNYGGNYGGGSGRNANYGSQGIIVITYTPAPTKILSVKVSGVWKTATPFVKVAGVWKSITPFYKVGGIWK